MNLEFDAVKHCSTMNTICVRCHEWSVNALEKPVTAYLALPLAQGSYVTGDMVPHKQDVRIRQLTHDASNVRVNIYHSTNNNTVSAARTPLRTSQTVSPMDKVQAFGKNLTWVSSHA